MIIRSDNNIAYDNVMTPIYNDRVIADGGTIETLTEVEEVLSGLGDQNIVPSLVWVAEGSKVGKDYSILPNDGSGDFDVVRAGDTSFTQNPDGTWRPALPNEPRFTYINGVKGRLIESAAMRLNDTPYSFASNKWTKSGVTVDNNGGAGYDGVFTDANGVNLKNAYKLVENTSNGEHKLSNSILGLTIGQRYTLCIFTKIAERKKIRIRNNSVTNFDVIIDLGTLTYTPTSINGTITIEPYNDYYKINISNYLNDVAAFNSIIIGLANDAGLTSYQGDGVSGLLICGFFLEAGTVASSPIGGAEGSAQTRNADVVAKTGVSALIGQTEGTLYVEINKINNKLEGVIIIYDPTSAGGVTGRIVIEGSGGSILARVQNTLGSNLFVTTPISNGIHRIAIGYKQNDCVLYIDGVNRGTLTSINIPPNMSSINLGSYQGGASPFNNLITNALLFKTRLPNATLQALTTL